jgi:hypothetical protein
MNILQTKTITVPAFARQKNFRSWTTVIAVGALIGALTSCTPTATENDKKSTDTQLQKYQANQPIPQADWSQYRQTVIDVTQAQIHGMATTTFQFNQGVADPIDSCPSIGFAVPSTAQLTNPDQAVSSGATVAQAEPNGVFTGDSTGTYIVCVDPNGKKYIDYWEGYVKTVGGPAHWDSTKKDVVLDGVPTVVANTK